MMLVGEEVVNNESFFASLRSVLNEWLPEEFHLKMRATTL